MWYSPICCCGWYWRRGCCCVCCLRCFLFSVRFLPVGHYNFAAMFQCIRIYILYFVYPFVVFIYVILQVAPKSSRRTFFWRKCNWYFNWLTKFIYLLIHNLATFESFCISFSFTLSACFVAIYKSYVTPLQSSR